jgi:hypothetical protein
MEVISVRTASIGVRPLRRPGTGSARAGSARAGSARAGAGAAGLVSGAATAAGLVAGYALDALLGDPRRFHPVAGFGRAAGALERRLYRDRRSAGAVYTALAVGVPVLAGAAVNLVPSRLTGLLTIAAAPLAYGDRNRAWRDWRRDRDDHPSPNAGQCEAAMAGALGVRLGGRNSYFGRSEVRPYLGDGPRPEARHIRRAAKLSGAVGLGALAIAGIVATVAPSAFRAGAGVGGSVFRVAARVGGSAFRVATRVNGPALGVAAASVDRAAVRAGTVGRRGR